MLKKVFRNQATILMFFIFVAVFLFITTDFVLAQGADLGLNQAAEIGLVESQLDIKRVIINVIRYILSFLAIVAVSMIIYAGFMWMTSGDNEEKLRTAKDTLRNAVIGLIIVIAAFAIVSFIAAQFGIRGWGIGGGPGGPGQPLSGIGALGACSIQSVYPEPGQNDVPRNTSILVTFREPVAMETICANTNESDELCDCTEAGGCDSINPTAVKIFPVGSRDACLENGVCITNVSAISTDGKTFVFIPREYLGNSSEPLWHVVYLTNDIKKQGEDGLGAGIFDDCRADWFEWDFEVSTELDFTPPQVKSSGVFPYPDDARDTKVNTGAVQAVGSITVNQKPKGRILATFGNPTGSFPATTSDQNISQGQTGTLRLAVQPDGKQAVLSNQDTNTSLGTAEISGRSITFENFFTLTLTRAEDNFAAGNFWEIEAIAYQAPDTLRVGSIDYIFIDGGAMPNNGIAVNNDNSLTAQNVYNALISNPDILLGAKTGATVNIKARVAGRAGNNLALTTTSGALTLQAMTGGADIGQNVTVNDELDVPRNAVVQVTFNEPILPVTVSGAAVDLQNYIKVINLDTNPTGFLEGKFMVSNLYRTVEFVTDDLCGVNGCGEEIYCLPEDSHIAVLLKAASLATCGADNCASRAPFNVCESGHCADIEGVNFPLAVIPFNGIMDTALNSLDGDRSSEAEGPVAIFNENTAAGEGDNFQWSFFVSDVMDIAAPVITGTVPMQDAYEISLFNPILVAFSKIMMSSTMNTGAVTIFNGQENVEHKLMNLWNFGNQAVGYWAASENIDSSEPEDGRPDYSQAEIRHTVFPDALSFRSQIGSGLKDIFQNCFKPSAGPACDNINDALPSCCSGTEKASSNCD